MFTRHREPLVERNEALAIVPSADESTQLFERAQILLGEWIAWPAEVIGEISMRRMIAANVCHR